MEGLIIFIIMSLIASFFGKKKEPENNAPKPINRPQQQKPVNQNPFKNLGDLAKEFQQQQQSQMEQKEAKREVPVPLPSPVQVKGRGQELPDHTINHTIDHRKPSGSKGRLSAHQQSTPRPMKEKPVLKNVLPSTEEDILRGIIFSEILGTPKSKR